MSSTKRKQNKPQKIFNSKSNKSLSSETTTTTTASIATSTPSSTSAIANLNKISLPEKNKRTTQPPASPSSTLKTERLEFTQEEAQVWRVITDLASTDTNNNRQSIEMNENENSTFSAASAAASGTTKLDINSLLEKEPMLNLSMNPYFYHQAIAAAASANNAPTSSAASSPFSSPNFMQAIEKLILMNLTPYLLGMLNSQQQQLTQTSHDFTSSYLENNFPSYEASSSAFSAVKKNETSQISMIKESIENFFSQPNSQDYIKQAETFKKKQPDDSYGCSCGLGFDSAELLLIHMKHTGHQAKLDEKSQLIKNKESELLRQYNNHQRRDISGCSSPSFTTGSSKMVRGQEEWVKNSRDNNFISQILKCLECSASFDTLADLSQHMVNSNHFSKFQQQSSFPLTPTSPVINPVKPAESSTKHKSNDSHNSVCKNNTNHSYSSQFFPNSKQFKPKKADSPTNLPISNTNTNQTSIANINNNGTSCRLKNSIISQPEHKCSICNKKFDHNSTESNSLVHNQLGLKLAEAKQQQLPPLVKLIQHLQNVHKITNVCTNCGAFFNNTDDLQKHLVEESFHHHHNHNYNHNYHHHLGNNQIHQFNTVNCSNKNKTSKRTSLNSNLNPKRFKPSEQIVHLKPEHTTAENSLSELSDSLKLNLPLSNKQRNETENNRYLTSSKLITNTNSISPSSSTSSSYSSKSTSSSSSNSSPPSFLFDQQHTANKEKLDSHPLLALQMFVNGSTLATSAEPKSPNSSTVPPPPPLVPLISTESSANSSLTSSAKLPAKKRPYIEEKSESPRSNLKQLITNDNSMLGNKLSSLKHDESCFVKRSRPNSIDENGSFTKENKKCHSPLNLLQKMQIGLDDYLLR